MEKSRFDKFMDWLKQPSTVKAIVIFAGLFGAAVEPQRVTEIIMSAAVLYGGIAAFWDKG